MKDFGMKNIKKMSEKEKTNRKWTSSDNYRENYSKIFPRDRDTLRDVPPDHSEKDNSDEKVQSL